MKKFILTRAAVLATMAILACGFTACSDDDGDGGSTPQGPVATFNGKLVTSVGPYSMKYDSKGRCVEAKYGSSDYVKIDYEKGTMVFSEMGSMGAEDVEYKVSFNGAGYITSLTGSYNLREGKDSYDLKENTKLSYDGSGHLVAISSNFSEKLVEGGDTYTYSEKGDTKVTWKDGSLVRYTYKGEDVEDGDKETYASVIDFNVSDIDNKFNQWTTAEEDGIMETDGMGYAGLLGKGSSKLVNSSTEIEDEDGYERPYTCTFAFTLNNDGTINSERNNYSSWQYYSYNSFVNGDKDSEKAPFVKTKAGNKKHGLKLFKLLSRLESIKARMNSAK